jgi:hypothetical protein
VHDGISAAREAGADHRDVGHGEIEPDRRARRAGLQASGHRCGWCEPQPDGRQRWCEDAIQALLATKDTDVRFVAGCEENQVKFHPRSITSSC